MHSFPVFAMSDITLKIGEREFVTTRDTLTKSRYLSGLLLVEGDHARTGHQYQLKRIDRDGDIFEHILRYLRTNKAPLFYDPVTKFDEVLYDRLRTESEFYGCQDLTDYLRAKNYRDAVKVIQYVETINDYE